MTSPPAPTTGGAASLAEVLLTHVDGMRRVYGPESGAFGGLHATQAGMHALGQAKLDKPQCRFAGQLDARAVADAPGAVVAFATPAAGTTGPARTVTEAVVMAGWFPETPPMECARFTATVAGQEIVYVTAPVRGPGWGDDTQGFLTTAETDGQHTNIGTVVMKYRGVLMSLLVVGAKVNHADVIRQSELALANLRRVLV
ncbi:hypothetical protein Acor_73440 [Acrocarpospora corrugata]|uniref:PknH-like extracellular domain-containing protein n=1 Tax=Acrocarpospora corrugata TaxID=35763 RepID=A0A5M3W8X1_9ACTN|nr:hypothetical protein [Acrocarpospora corrugata]GES05276.1 hypothetical protein Acor_73440 [Acrocarpospora corrugata]